jgi:hypothetical protein
VRAPRRCARGAHGPSGPRPCLPPSSALQPALPPAAPAFRWPHFTPPRLRAPVPYPHPLAVVALYFHTATIVLSAAPLAAAWPQRAALPSGPDAALLLAIAATSFAGQLLLTRGFQLMPASRAASINFSQVRGKGRAGAEVGRGRRPGPLVSSRRHAPRTPCLLHQPPTNKPHPPPHPPPPPPPARPQVIYSYAFGIALFSDAITWAGAGGSALIAAGIFLVNAKSNPRSPAPRSVEEPGAPAKAAAAAPAPAWGGEAGGEEKTSAAARDAAGAGVGSKLELRLFVGASAPPSLAAAPDAPLRAPPAAALADAGPTARPDQDAVRGGGAAWRAAAKGNAAAGGGGSLEWPCDAASWPQQADARGRHPECWPRAQHWQQQEQEQERGDERWSGRQQLQRQRQGEAEEEGQEELLLLVGDGPATADRRPQPDQAL